ncbi:hypothetical protein [uncultured Paracoccus sp.]|uniref:hypothetical protein n=1 Tax=uncultured Paracoccus sp. TaxID=189685 RepID=UPI00260A5565|nr:hypothetical protein [uncultured Paracoccus sp.]
MTIDALASAMARAASARAVIFINYPTVLIGCAPRLREDPRTEMQCPRRGMWCQSLQPGRSARRQRHHGDRQQIPSFEDRTVEFRHGDICARLLRNLIGRRKFSEHQ